MRAAIISIGLAVGMGACATPRTPPAYTGLENHPWVIEQFRYEKELVSSGSMFKSTSGGLPAKPFIIFSGGAVEGGSGCGSWVGKYKLDGDKLTLSAFSILSGWCLDENIYAAGGVELAINGERVVEISKDRAVFKSPDGEIQAVLVAQP
jgi:heat shock protein HslJ